MNRIVFFCFTIVSLVWSQGLQVTAQKAKPAASDQSEAKNASNVEKKRGNVPVENRGQRLAEFLSGSKFVGKFTIEGQDDAAPKTEEYTISKCEKLDQPDMYRLTARIKYGEVDSEVPLDLKILWAGNTPVITMDAFWIPGMGTFGARVLIHSNRYAGTWQHDAVGGHLYGVIRKGE